MMEQAEQSQSLVSMTSKPINKKYLSGFFDGEGHSYINNRGVVIIEIQNCSLDVLKKIENTYGGTIRLFSYSPGGLIEKYRKKRKLQWRYRLFRQNDVLKFLLDIQENLIIKKDIVKSQIDYLLRQKAPQGRKRI